MDSPVQKIKERLSIEEVVSSYIKLEQAGSNLKARCPFHNEKTPSFFISPARGSYFCFGCSAKGDIFSFVEEFEGLDFRGALKLLADKAGVPLDSFTREDKGEKERLYLAMEEAAKFYESNLREEQMIYLKSRGLQNETIKDFRVGYAENDWRILYNHLKAKGFSDKEIETAGLAKKSEKGFYDRFRGRIMFPISDSSGRVIAFSGRIFVDDGKSAKYLNSPDTPIFSKFAVLYGLDRAKDSIRKNNFSILVEGQMDLLMSHQAGFRNTIATSGTALSDSTVSKENAISNLGLVRRLSQNIVLAFDADKAGFNASLRGAKIALALGMDVKVAQIGEGMDPADLIAKKGVDKWREAIRNSLHVIDFLLAKVTNEEKDERKIGRIVKEKVLPFVEVLESAIEKSHFVKRISEKTGIPIHALEEDLEKVTTEVKESGGQESVPEGRSHFRKDSILRRLLGIALWQSTLSSGEVEPKKILESISEILGKESEEILKENEVNKEDLIFEAETFYGQTPTLKKDVEELVGNLKEEYLREKLFKKMKELEIVETKKDKESAKVILQEINVINNQIEALKGKRTTK